LQRVHEFMREHLDEPLTLEAIAREAGLSRFHTLRLFKNAFGETPLRRLARLRMERARTCLSAGDEPVTEIAFRCGYENPAHFASAFRRWTGVSPTKYRTSSVVRNAPGRRG
jgi:AraC family transcriptional regulator